MTNLAEVKLETLGGGALAELFEREWARVLANIQDPNTPAEKKRGITIKIGIEPDEARERAAVSLECEAKVVGPKGAKDLVYMGMRDGKVVGVRYDPRQSDMFDDPERDVSDVTPLPVRTEAER